MESLELIKDTFINEELQENFSDLIYRVKINNKDAYISFLLEHKSYKDKLAIFQLNKLTAMMLKAFRYTFEEDIEIVLRNFLMAIEEVEKEESLETIIYYGQIYLRYIELTNKDITEEDIKKEIERLDGKGAITMSILEKRELLGMEKGIEKGIEKVAKNLLREGAEIALVVKATGLSKSEVEKLKEELNS